MKTERFGSEAGRLISGGTDRVAMQITPRIDRRIVDADFVMNVRRRSPPALSNQSNHFTALHMSTDVGIKRGKVSIPGRNSETMVDDHQTAITATRIDEHDDAVS